MASSHCVIDGQSSCKETKILRLFPEEMGHPQPPTPVHCDNKTATDIANDTVKKHRSRSMEMRYFWVTDQVKRRILNVMWHPGKENLGEYIKTPHWDTPQACASMLHSHEQFISFTSKSTGAKHSERVCWNPRTRVPKIGTTS